MTCLTCIDAHSDCITAHHICSCTQPVQRSGLQRAAAQHLSCRARCQEPGMMVHPNSTARHTAGMCHTFECMYDISTLNNLQQENGSRITSLYDTHQQSYSGCCSTRARNASAPAASIDSWHSQQCTTSIAQGAFRIWYTCTWQYMIHVLALWQPANPIRTTSTCVLVDVASSTSLQPDC
jgi:hypothetical protein